MGRNTAALTDLYEYTMLDGFVQQGIVNHPSVFELFTRRLPAGRRYGIVAGLDRALELLEDFHPGELVDWLVTTGVIPTQNTNTLDYLRNWKFTGDIHALPEGSRYYPDEPVLTVVAPLGEAVLLETLLLSVLNYDSAVASAAARMVVAAGGRPIIEMGSRRVNEDAAVAAARAAYIAGFVSTSNMEAGIRYGVPVGGTAAHAFTLAHLSEVDAFRSQVAAQGVGTTLLVDTYDTPQGIRNAVMVAREFGGYPGGVRIDSGDLSIEAHKARALLDELGAVDTKIVTTSDLDEYVITALQDAPIDVYGVGTRVATGSGAPTAEMVYKLVEIDGRPVSKKAAGKKSVGGRKYTWTTPTDHGYSMDLDELPEGSTPTQEHVVVKGCIKRSNTALEEARERCAKVLSGLSVEDRKIAMKNEKN